MLRDLGVDLVMLGHAERRHKFGETDIQVNKKVQSAINHQLRVLLCVGETAKQRRAGITDEVLAMQLKVALLGFPDELTDQLMVAYEPVWAIGAGSQEAQPQDIAPSINHIKHTLNTCFGEAARRISVLYGGSVSESNCSDYVQKTEVDGLFVGRAAWQPEGFMNVLRAATTLRHDDGKNSTDRVPSI
jgi:triosephosphate isomerase